MYVVIYDTLLQRSDRSISYRLIFTYLANLDLARRWVFSCSSSSFLCSFILQAYSLWVKCWSKCSLSLELGPQCLMLSQPCLFDNKQINILSVLVYHLNLLSMSLQTFHHPEVVEVLQFILSLLFVSFYKTSVQKTSCCELVPALLWVTSWEDYLGNWSELFFLAGPWKYITVVLHQHLHNFLHPVS